MPAILKFNSVPAFVCQQFCKSVPASRGSHIWESFGPIFPARTSWKIPSKYLQISTRNYQNMPASKSTKYASQQIACCGTDILWNTSTAPLWIKGGREGWWGFFWVGGSMYTNMLLGEGHKNLTCSLGIVQKKYRHWGPVFNYHFE